MDIETTIDRFEGEKAIIKTKDNESIIWPKNKLPTEAKEGSVIVINIQNAQEKESDKKQLAKDILNEILRTEGE